MTGNLIEEVATKLDTSALSFGADIATVSSIVGESERKRREYLAAHASGGSRADAGVFEKGSERYLELKRKVVLLSSRLTDQVAGLEKSFIGLAALLSRFQNIVVASRIEVAKTSSLAGVATTVGGMIELTARIEADVGAAMETTKDFTSLAIGALGGYSVQRSASRAPGSDGEGVEDERLVSTLRAVEEDIGRLSSDQDSLRVRHRGVLPLYRGIHRPHRRARARSSRGSGRSTRDCRPWARASPSSSRRFWGPTRSASISALDSERLHRMVERFTIFTHKKVAGSIGRFSVEEGGQAGEVTIF